MQQRALDMATDYKPDRDREKTRERVRLHREVKKAREKVETERATERANGLTIPQAKNATGFEAADIIKEWAESTLVVPTGPLSGQPIIAHPYLYDWTGHALDDSVTEAAMSIARKNAKTGWIAVVDLCYLIGPLNRKNWRGVVGSLNGKLALEMRSALEQTAKAANLRGLDIHRSPTPGVAYGLQGAQLDFLAADKGSGHAVGGDLAILDEGGLMEENLRWLWNSIDSATSGRDGKLWVLSIQATGPMFAEMEQRDLEGNEPHLFFQRWAAEADAAIDDPDGWAAANPGLMHGIKSLRFMQTRAARALSVPLDQPAFRAQHLNQKISPGTINICTMDDWITVERRWSPILKRGPVILGLDIGGSDAMTAATAYWPETGGMQGFATLPGSPSLRQRGKADAVGSLYEQMERVGDLTTQAGQRTVNVPRFLADVRDRLGDADIKAVVTDTYKKADVAQKVEQWARSTDCDIVLRGGPNSQSATGAHDLIAFQTAIKSRLAFMPSTVMLHAINRSNIKMRGVTLDIPTLSKVSQTSRIDVLQAAVIAVGLSAELGYEEQEPAQIEVHSAVTLITPSER